MSKIRALALLVALVAPLTISAAEKESRPGVYRGYSEPRYSGWVSSSRYVAVRDGTRLAVDIYRPAENGTAAAGRFPVIWIHTPYRRAWTRPDGKKATVLESWGMLELIKHGYVLAAVDTRGRGASFGARRGFQDRTEAQDAYDMTEWFAAQPWSDGNIGVMGCSYMGGSTFHAATVAPPHLRAIAPGCTDFDKYGFVSRGGITAQFNTRPENPEQDYGQGVLPVDEDKDGTLAAQAIAGHAAGTPMAELWRGMPFRDDVSPLLHVPFWREVSPATYKDVIERSGVGIFIWGNWLDEGSFEATLAFNNLKNPRKLWMGGWGHCQVGDFPMATELLRFFDHFLKKVDNGWEREPPIYYYTLGAPKGSEWSSARQWPLPEARSKSLALGGTAVPGRAGTLGLSGAARSPADAAARLHQTGNVSGPRGLGSSSDGVDYFVVNYAPVCEGKVDLYFIMWPCVVRDHGLSYETPPLTADVHVAGHPLADLWISSSATDADVFVYLEKITPSGDVSIVTHGRLRASLRSEQRPALNYMGLPYHRGNRADAKPLVPNTPARMRLDLLPTSIIVKSGERLRLTIAGADPRQRSRSVQFDPPPTIGIYHDAKHRSQLFLPVLSEPQFAPVSTE
ncbi:MAG TPA: CocE/NonD family hydrolase [Steroidobacteraceae bacterium]|jgi:putative CocE/NonD family hydrolase|nr:CocE/NonD family hydrolase [Steroidobacteraceae bacterium]